VIGYRSNDKKLAFAGTVRRQRADRSVSRGLGTIERAVAACIKRCREPNADANLYTQMGKEPPAPVVHVTAWGVCVHLNPPPVNIQGWKRPTETQLKAAKRAMHSFVQKFPDYGVMSAKGGRGRLCLYERGDKLSAMWAKLASQSGDHMTLSDAMEALVYAGERRNEPFTLKGKRYIEYRSKNHSLTRREPRVFRDLDIAEG
jgi:hypothetical protein